MGSPLSLPVALGWIVASLFVVTGGGVKSFRFYQSLSPCVISAIVQTGPEKEALKTAYLAELLGLSWDKPELFSHYDTKKAQEKLLASPFIAKAVISKQPGGVLLIDYCVRKPLFWILDYDNLAVDRDGFLFPIRPFFSPKKLPELYFGAPVFKGWKSRMQGKKFDLAEQLFSELLKQNISPIYRIDVSQALAPSLGRREIVVGVGEGKAVHYLRLSCKHFRQELVHYRLLRQEWEKSGGAAPRVVDLRIPNLAFLK